MVKAICAAVCLVIVLAGCTGHHSAAKSESTSAGPEVSRTSSNGWPDASTTGVPASVKLKRVPQDLTSGNGWHWRDGFISVTEPNVVLSGLDVAGSVQSKQSNLTIRDSYVRCTNEPYWCLTLGAHSTVTDTEVGGGADGKTNQHGIGLLSAGPGNVITRVNIHHTVHGMRIDGGTTVQDSYIHDLPMGDAGFEEAHTDGIMSTAGTDTVIRHNRIETGNTATLFVQWEDGNAKIGSYLVEGNFFVNVTKNTQVSSEGVAIENKGIQDPSKIVVRDNVFTTGWEVGPIEIPRGAVSEDNTFVDAKLAEPFFS
jgi:hypothetical protein